MGLSALTRKGWKDNPKRQGIINLSVAILALIIGNAIEYFVYGNIMSMGINLFLLGWGIISYFTGLVLAYTSKK